MTDLIHSLEESIFKLMEEITSMGPIYRSLLPVCTPEEKVKYHIDYALSNIAKTNSLLALLKVYNANFHNELYERMEKELDNGLNKSEECLKRIILKYW